jgi:hypothetical protein
MHIRPNTVVIDDEHVPAATAAGSAEPMRRADYKSKKHSRPARKSETLGGGHFVFRRHADGRIHPRQDPFEHGTLAEAVTEMERLVSRHGGEFEVFSRVGWVKWDVVDEAHTDGGMMRSYSEMLTGAKLIGFSVTPAGEGGAA